MLLSGCNSFLTPEAHTDATKTPEYPFPDYDLISGLDGSTVTIPLSEAILNARLGKIDGLIHSRTDSAYEKLINSEKDIILVTYPSNDEFARARQSGVELEIVPVVKDALVFLVNGANPVADLTHTQIRDIYTASITNWKAVNGGDQPIIPYQRPANSGSQTLFLKLAMNELIPMDAPTGLRLESMSDLVRAVAGYDNATCALGYSLYYYVNVMDTSERVKLLAVDGATPSQKTITDGDYPYITYYYAVIRKDTPEGHPARELIAWLLSDTGQKIAQSAGYVPMSRLADGEAKSGFYSFFGSTPENTRRSAGTGGAQPRVISDRDWNTIFTQNYDNSDNRRPPRLLSVNLHVSPALQNDINAWLTRVNKMSGDSYRVRNYLLGDLFCLELWDIEHGITDAAVFDLREGRRMTLSDLFYDGVNYIEFINENLIRVGANLLDWEFNRAPGGFVDEVALKRPFTGIPNDYPRFTLFRGIAGRLELVVAFPPDNPFFNKESFSGSLRLGLPIDLSPWGELFEFNYRRETIEEGLTVNIPFVRTGVNTQTLDAKINCEIEKMFEEVKATGQLQALASEAKGDVLWTADMAVSGDGRLSVGYRVTPHITEPGTSSRKVGMVTIDMRSGQPVTVTEDILPARWWENTGSVFLYERDSPISPWKNLDFLETYVPPAGAIYRNFWLRSGGDSVLFEIVEPDGRIVIALAQIRHIQAKNVPTFSGGID